MSRAIVRLQNVLPQRWLARSFGRLARSRAAPVRRLMIEAWTRAFDVSLAECARRRVADYRSFEDFFTRELAPGARPMPADPDAVAAPVDGELRAFGRLREGRLIQAKGIDYPLGALLGEYEAARPFRDAWYATFYLAPSDYHRIHAPCRATLRTTIEVPGQAYSVTAPAHAELPALYCRNERLACLFDTPAGAAALIMVGAMLVTGIETVWRGASPIERWARSGMNVDFERGAEIGRFTLGSTVVLVLPPDAFAPRPELTTGVHVRVGEAIGRWSS